MGKCWAGACRGPLSVAFEVTAQCNERCSYCYRGGGKSDPDPCGTDQALSILEHLWKTPSLRQVTLTGGEPFLRSDLLQIIDKIAAADRQVAIISSAGCVDAALAEALAERVVGYVQVTLLGPDATVHDPIASSGSYAARVRGIRHLVAAGVPVGCAFICTAANYHHVAETYEHFRELGARQHFVFLCLNPVGPAREQQRALVPSVAQAQAALDRADAFAERHGIQVHNKMPLPFCLFPPERFPHVTFGTCGAGTPCGECAVSLYGQVRLCAMQTDVAGSLFTTSLRDFSDGELAHRLRAGVPAACEGCAVATECLGGCPAARGSSRALHAASPAISRLVRAKAFTS